MPFTEHCHRLAVLAGAITLMLAVQPSFAVVAFLSEDSFADFSHKSFPNTPIDTHKALIPATPAAADPATHQALNDDASDARGGISHLTVAPGDGTGIANAVYPTGIMVDQARGPEDPGFTTTSREQITFTMYWDVSDGWGPGPLVAYDALVVDLSTSGPGDLARVTGTFTHEIDEYNDTGPAGFVADHSVTLSFGKLVRDGDGGTFTLFDADTLMDTALDPVTVVDVAEPAPGDNPSSPVEARHLYRVTGDLTLYAQDPSGPSGSALNNNTSLIQNLLSNVLPTGLAQNFYANHAGGIFTGVRLRRQSVPEPITGGMVIIAMGAGAATCLRRRRRA